MYSKAQLKRMIELASELGIDDDVKHWTKELNKFEDTENKEISND